MKVTEANLTIVWFKLRKNSLLLDNPIASNINIQDMGHALHKFFQHQALAWEKLEHLIYEQHTFIAALFVTQWVISACVYISTHAKRQLVSILLYVQVSRIICLIESDHALQMM